MAKVSIIIPNYNYEVYLPQRLDSVIRQTFQDFEIILLDDCSTDGSKQVMLSYANNPKVTHVAINDKNSGNPFVQWAKGIALAQGEYIWIAESDDLCDATFLEKMVSILDHHPDVAFTMCGSHLIDENNKPIHDDYDKWKSGTDDKQVYKYSSYQYLKHFLLWYNASYNASMIVFRKELVAKTRMDFAAMRYCGDWLFWVKMAELGNVAVLHERLNYFRRHSKSVTFNSDGQEKQLGEKMMIYTYLWSHHHFGFYRDFLSRGYLYKEITRIKMDKRKKKQAIGKLQKYGVSRAAYCFERLIKTTHQIIPCLPAPKYDYVKGERIRFQKD